MFSFSGLLIHPSLLQLRIPLKEDFKDAHAWWKDVTNPVLERWFTILL